MDSAKTSLRCQVKTLTHPERSAQKRAGYTLVEIMVVVTIIGVLATIATPMYMGYVYRSKTSEATAIMAEIARAQDAYYSIQNRRSYYSASDDQDDWYPPISGREPGDEQVAWRTSPPNDKWDGLLGAQPQGYSNVYFRYQTFGDAPGDANKPSKYGLPDYGYDGHDAWWICRAIADLDGDDINVTFQRSSGARGTYISNSAGWE
jgi:prepilin-type N-terminal cleavage/methylation domain-containing protein